MKWRSPILFLLLIVAGGCKQKPLPNADAPFKRAWTIMPMDSALVGFDRLIEKSYSANTDAQVYTALSWKANYLVAVLPDSLPPTLKKLKKSVTALGTDAAIGFYQSKMGDYYLHIQAYDSAFYYYNSGAKLLLKDPAAHVTAAYNLMKLAEIQQVYNDYRGAESTATEALDILKARDAAILKELYNTLAISFSGVKDYDSAIEYYKRAAPFATDSVSKDIIENNIAYTYGLSGNSGKAITMLSALLKSPAISASPMLKSMVLDNLGYLLYKAKSAQGVPLMHEALTIAISEQHLQSQPDIYLHLAEAYADVLPAVTVDYCKKAYASASATNSIDKRIAALQGLVSYTDGTDMKQYAREYFRLNDSISDVRIKATNQFAKWKYDLSDVKKQSAEKDNKLAQARRDKIIYFLLILLVTVSAIFIYTLLRIRHRKEKRREGYKTERRIAKKVHDELANDIFHTITLAETADLSNPEAREKLLARLAGIYSSTRNISKENSAIDTGDGFQRQLHELLSLYQTEATAVYQSGLDAINWPALPEHKKTAVYRIIQELLTNMKKHSQCNRALFTFAQQGADLVVAYKDDGVGIIIGNKNEKNGLLNVENRIHELGGTITFDQNPEKGYGLTFTIPVKK
jgi:signal transduction histidine kinase